MLLNATVSYEHNEVKLLKKNNYFVSIEIGVKEVNNGYLNKIKTDKLFYKKLTQYITVNAIKFSRIIFRYPFASLGLKQFAKNFQDKIVFEHNTKEIEELTINIRNKKYAFFGLRPSLFFFWLQEKKYPLFCEKYISKQIFNYAHSGACVTSEIAAYEHKRNRNYKTFVSSNFYNVSETILSTSFYDEKADVLTIGMIVTTSASWYGLDRLFGSFALVQNNYKLVVAGIEKSNEYVERLLAKNGIQKNIEFLGKINKDELNAFYNSIHVCFGSLGLHRLNLNFASTLKVKESVSFGVPVVIAYNEEDFFKNDDFFEFYLQLENSDQLIDFELIRAFAAKFYSNPENKVILRNLAFKYMDVQVKMKSLIDNVKSI